MTVPQRWIRKTMDMFGIAKSMDKILNESMRHWNTNLMVGKQQLRKVNIPGCQLVSTTVRIGYDIAYYETTRS